MHREQPPDPEDGEGKERKTSIGDWVNKLFERGLISRKAAEQIIDDNSIPARKERFKKYNLPEIATFGPVATFDELEEIIPQHIKERKLVIRCEPKNYAGSKLRMEREFGLHWNEVQDFVAHLPGGKERYDFRIQEYYDPEYAGTIIADGEGKLLIEIIQGQHFVIEKSSLSQIKKVVFDSKTGYLRLQWDPTFSEEEKKMTLRMLSYFLKELTRENLEQLEIYADFGYRKDEGFRFLDMAEDNFWTKL